MSSAVTPQLVQRVFELYKDDKLVVNRRYQRKLVWSVEEKQKFIDSLVKGYPIPMILTSKYGSDDSKLEILDGLQRLNAITSFIECDYDFNGLYFDLDSIALTKSLKENGALKQKEPRLTVEQCSVILNYQIPFLTTHINTPEFIDETFRRINTGGRRLSRQDVRQAGSLGIVSETVNKISNYVRKDSSRTDIITLRNMKNISIGDSSLNYGININDIFWVKENIIRKNDIRESRDEELIAHLLCFVADPKKAHTTSEYLDRIYDSSSSEHSNLSGTLTKYEKDYLIKTFNYIFDELAKIFKSDRTNFADTVYGTRKKVKSSQCFQVIFLSIYDLIINEGMTISNYKDLHSSLNGISHSLFSGMMNENSKWHNSDRTKLINATKGVIKAHFSKAKNNDFEPGNWIKNLENIINESMVEQQSYDFKMGLVTIKENTLNKNLIEKILKTLTAMTNSIGGECTVIVGVAENESDAKEHESKYSRSYIRYNDKFIVGIQAEANYLYGSVDLYLKTIKDIISSTKTISDTFKREVLNKMATFRYKGKEIIIFRAERGENPESFNSKYYERHLSHNNEVSSGDPMTQLFMRFFNRK